MKVLKILRSGGNISGIAVNGKEYKVLHDIVQCAQGEIDEVAKGVADHGFAHQILDDGVTLPPAPVNLPNGVVLSGSFEAKQRGGQWAIVEGDGIIADGLTKAEADAFNAMPIEAQAIHIADLRRVASGTETGTGHGTGNADTTGPDKTPVPLEAVKKGKAYSVMRGDDEVFSGLTKAEADLFNDQTQPEREAMLRKALEAKLAKS